MIVSALRIPARCCTAPEMPSARYTFGLTVLPDCPTWRAFDIQPASTSGRDTLSVAPSLLGQLRELRDVVLVLDAAADREQELGLGDVDVAGLRLAELDVLGRRRVAEVDVDRAHSAEPRLGRLEGAGAQHQQRRLACRGSRARRRACRRRRRGWRPARPSQPSAEHVAGEAEPAAGRDGRARSRASRSCGRQDDARAARPSISASSARCDDVRLEVLRAATPPSAPRRRRRRERAGVRRGVGRDDRDRQPAAGGVLDRRARRRSARARCRAARRAASRR